MKIKSILSLALILVILASPAWAGCGRWVVRDNTDFLADPLFDAAMESSSGINASSGSEEVAANQTENSSTSPAPETIVQKEDPIIDLSGKWRMNLNEGGTESAKIMDIILIQSGDRLQGYGSVMDGDSDPLATATGAVSGDEISLQVKVNSQQKDYRLDLVHEDGRLQGRYELYQEEKLAESGNATAGRSGA